jgi:hypothetical protein
LPVLIEPAPAGSTELDVARYATSASAFDSSRGLAVAVPVCTTCACTTLNGGRMLNT